MLLTNLNAKRVLHLLVWVTSMLLLAGCDSGASSVSSNPHEAPRSNSQHERIAYSGRIAIVPRDEDGDLLPRLYLYGLEKQRVLATSIELHNVPSALHTGPGRRFVLATQRRSNQVQIIASGIYRHNGHTHKRAPHLVGTIYSPRPTHYRTRGEQAALYFDGEAAQDWPAEVMVFTTDSLEDGKFAAAHTLPEAHHGVAVPFGGLLLVTHNADNDILAEQVNVLSQHKRHYHYKRTLQKRCPGLHGAGANTHYAVFGCSNGVLVVHYRNGHFTAKHWDNIKLGLHGNERIGDFDGHHALSDIVAYAGDHVIVLDPAHGTATQLHWKDGAQVHLDAYTLTPNGAFLLLLDSKGYLHIFDTNDWSEYGHLKVIKPKSAAPPLPPHAHGSRFSMTVSGSPAHAFIADAGNKEIVVVDIRHVRLEGSLPLSFAPGYLAWVGLTETTGRQSH